MMEEPAYHTLDQKVYRRINFMLNTVSYTMNFEESKVQSYILTMSLVVLHSCSYKSAS